MESPDKDLPAFLSDPELFNLVTRLARRYVRDEHRAEDLRQDAYKLAITLVRKGKGPHPGYERAWMCCLLQLHAKATLRRLKKELPLVDATDIPELPAPDTRELTEALMEQEELIDAALQVVAQNRQHADLALGPDARKDKDAPAQDAAGRKRKERARTFLADKIRNALTAAATGIVVGIAVFFAMRRPQPSVAIVPTLTWNETTLASASRELAAKSCAASEWSACLAHLEDVKRLNPAAFGRDEQSAHDAAIANLRSEAQRACLSQRWDDCLSKLDEARHYDPEGDRAPPVVLERSEAYAHTGGGLASPGEPNAKGPF